MDTKQLENLIALVEEGNVRDALRQHISQPGLSMSIKRLEESDTCFNETAGRSAQRTIALSLPACQARVGALNLGRADLPGAENISRDSALEKRDDRFIGNLTGNLEEGFAYAKLSNSVTQALTAW